MIELSIVIPVYQCENGLEELHRRLQKSLRQITSRYEILFVEDRSLDRSWEVLTRLAKKDHKIKAFRLSKNFGQHAAITAGLSKSSGNWTVVMDCDLQDPPEDIVRFYLEAKKGYDIVFGKRKEKKQFFLRRWLGKAYFKINNFFNQSHVDGSLGSFSILSKKVVNAFLAVDDRDRHFLFILFWLGFKTAVVEYDHGKRLEGKSSYSFRALFNLAFNGVFFQTTVLLQWIVYLGFGLSVSGIGYAAWIFYQYFFHSIPPGWTSLIVLIMLVGGFIIISTGITGLYIGKIFEQVKGRSMFVFDKRITDGVEK